VIRRFASGRGLLPPVLLFCLLLALLVLMGRATTNSAKFGQMYIGLLLASAVGLGSLALLILYNLFQFSVQPVPVDRAVSPPDTRLAPDAAADRHFRAAVGHPGGAGVRLFAAFPAAGHRQLVRRPGGSRSGKRAGAQSDRAGFADARGAQTDLAGGRQHHRQRRRAGRPPAGRPARSRGSVRTDAVRSGRPNRRHSHHGPVGDLAASAVGGRLAASASGAELRGPGAGRRRGFSHPGLGAGQLPQQ